MRQKVDRPRVIALFTDFGEQGPYTGQMEAVLYDRGVRQPIIRLISDAPARNPRAGAYLLAALASELPHGTLFLSVVDPGVGGNRRPVMLRTDRHWFVGPDNGLFSQVIRRSGRIDLSVIQWRPERSSASFHGRDLFAPVAARISRGEAVDATPLEAAESVGARWPEALHEIIYIDQFGNAFSGIRADSLATGAAVTVGGYRAGFAATFSDVPVGTVFWYRNSIGLVEIAVNQGRADRLLGLQVGDRVEPHNYSA